jgi:hypothetical protein
MGLVLFDWETPTTTKKVKNAIWARVCLFDGYLTETTLVNQKYNATK